MFCIAKALSGALQKDVNTKNDELFSSFEKNIVTLQQ